MIEALLRGRLQHMRFCKASPCSVSWCDRSSLSTIVAVIVATDEMDGQGVRQEDRPTARLHSMNLAVDAETTIENHTIAKNVYYSFTRHGENKIKDIKEEADGNKDEGAKENEHAPSRRHRNCSPKSVLEASIDLTSEDIDETFHDERGSGNVVVNTRNLDTCSMLPRLPLKPLKKRPIRNSFVKDMKKRTKIN